MSGPKVVRIVTREEIEVICRGHIATVAAAAAECRKRANRCDRFDPTLERDLVTDQAWILVGGIKAPGRRTKLYQPKIANAMEVALRLVTRGLRRAVTLESRLRPTNGESPWDHVSGHRLLRRYVIIAH